MRFLEGAGRRATLELVAEAVLELVRDGIAPEEIAIVVPVARALARVARDSVRRARRSRRDRDAAAPRRRRRSGRRCSRCCASPGATARVASSSPSCARRTPGSARSDVDFLEGRLRGRAVVRGDRTIEETTKLRTGRPLPMLELLARRGRRRSPPPGRSCCAMAAQRLRPRRSARQRRRRSATCAPPTRSAAILDELERLQEAGVAIRAEDVRLGSRARDRARRRRRRARPRGGARPRRAPARGRFEAVFVIGLEQGSLPRRDADVAVLRRRDAARARRRARRAAPAARRGEPRPLPLLHRLHPAATPADARARGGHRRRLAARAEPVLGGGVRALRRRRRAPPHDAAPARAAHVADRVGADRARAAARARPARRRRSPRGQRARVRERVAAQARPRARRVLAADGDPSSAGAGAAREPRDVPGHRPRADGGLLVGVVRRALPPAGRDRPGDRPDDARLDRARRAAALLQGAAERDPRRRARHAGERRGRRRADAPLRRQRARFGPPHRRRRPAAPRARPGHAARPRAARAGGGGGGVDVRAAQARGLVQGVRARAGRARSAARSTASTSTR